MEEALQRLFQILSKLKGAAKPRSTEVKRIGQFHLRLGQLGLKSVRYHLFPHESIQIPNFHLVEVMIHFMILLLKREEKPLQLHGWHNLRFSGGDEDEIFLLVKFIQKKSCYWKHIILALTYGLLGGKIN